MAEKTQETLAEDASQSQSTTSIINVSNTRSGFAVKLLIVFVVLSLLSLFYTATRPTALFLTVEMAVPQNSEARLFYDTGNGFNENESCVIVVKSGSVNGFRRAYFPLPRVSIFRFRVDPPLSAEHVLVRNAAVLSNKIVLARIPDDQIVAFSDPNNHRFIISPTTPIRLRWTLVDKNLRRLALINLLLILLCAAVPVVKQPILAGWNKLSKWIDAANGRLVIVAGRCAPNSFLRIDALALWVYGGILMLFLLACTLGLNGSSAAALNGSGPSTKPLLGSAKGTRSDEWGYSTPDILNQYYRSDRFAAADSVLGNHHIALTANVPVKDVSTLFRPQFWGFFVLPLTCAFSIYWQAKALILVGGVFTFLLWIIRSSKWALTGTLWYFFSPYTQWCYSWPSALPEMIGSACLGTICFCYLTVGQRRKWLAVAAIGTVYCGVNFAMCAYLPHLIPLVWLSLGTIATWCVAERKQIANRRSLGPRAAAIAISLGVLLMVGGVVFGELKTAIWAVADTSYPGHRIEGSGTMPAWVFASHFAQWTETESQFPAILGNMSEGSGYLWLAPLTLFFLPRLRLSPFQKGALVVFWCLLAAIFAWSAFPLPPVFGRITLLERSGPSRALDVLGLANIAIVCLCGARFVNRAAPQRRWRRDIAWLLGASAIFGGILAYGNVYLSHYFSAPELAIVALFLGVLSILWINGRWRAFSLLLIIPHAVAYGTVNPVERGLPMFTESAFHQFVQSHRELLDGKWLVYSGTVVRSGFVAAAGCQVYTGTRYLPDIDHFSLLAASGLDVNLFNRLGYLNAKPTPPGIPAHFEPNPTIVVTLSVAPNDPLLRQLGIRYVAFDQEPTANLLEGLTPLHPGPLDGLWLYRL